MNTTTHIPSDEELSAAVEKLEGSLGVAKTLSRIRELHPSWTLDSKRIRAIRIKDGSTNKPENSVSIAPAEHPDKGKERSRPATTTTPQVQLSAKESGGYPPPVRRRRTVRNSKVNDQRPHGTWPFTSIFKRTPTKHPTDPSFILVCDLCANAAEDGQLGRRTVSSASFVPKPPQLQDLNIGERAMIRKMSGVNLDSMTAAASQLKEGMIFPDLYPLGCGFWVKGDGPLSRSFEEDMEIKLNSVDPRWRTDQEWPTWAAAVAGGKVIPTQKGRALVV
ncbi:hypothetical protein C8J57DRAFT_1583827 [Mycena rebaudengoi]|nr:hypothetical protein C8J57DRAFT_1583827 [Mycena rebaudengoi]